MEYITTKEASAKWGISTIRITVLANEGRIPGAQRLGKSWMIPANAEKPPELKANHSGLPRKRKEKFSFPLYHFRADFNQIKESQLSEQQQKLLLAESAVLECRFEEAYKILKPLMHTPDDLVTEIGILWNAGICCICLNKLDDFTRIYLRMQMIFAEDFTFHDDLLIVLELLETYLKSINTSANSNLLNTESSEQCLPALSLINGYAELSKEMLKPGTVNVNSLELNLRFIKNTSATIVEQIMHLHLSGIYFLRNDEATAKKHAKEMIQIAYDNKYYYPLVTYYRYFAPILTPILEQYPNDFQKNCQKLIMQFNENSTAFFSSLSESKNIYSLTDMDYPYIYAALMDLSNAAVAEKLAVSPRTVNRKYEIIFEKLGVRSKKELKNYLKDYM